MYILEYMHARIQSTAGLNHQTKAPHYHYLAVYNHTLSLLRHSSFLCTDKDDHTRVELKKDPEVEGSDYINASFIDVSCLSTQNHANSLLIYSRATQTKHKSILLHKVLNYQP